MLKKSSRLNGNLSSPKFSLRLQRQPGAPQNLKKWSALILSALLMTLVSALLGPLDLLAAPLNPTANTWMNYSSSTNSPPEVRTRHMGVWDPIDNVMLVHGGFDDTSSTLSLNDTWKLDPSTGTWTQYTSFAGSTPPTRVNGCAVWDDLDNRMLVFGGQNYGPPSSPMYYVWSFDPTGNGTWTRFTNATNNPPDGLEAMACVWDKTAKKMLVYGGFDDVVRAFDPTGNGSWVDLTANVDTCGTLPTTSPGSRRYISFVWNPDQNVMMIWSGRDGCGRTSNGGPLYYNDLWTFAPNYAGHSGTWTKITTTGGPPLPRDRAAMVWDPTIHQMTIFGSNFDSTINGPTTYYNDVWSFKLTSTTTGQWSQRTPSGTAPGVRSDDLGVYDPVRNQILYFAGRIPVETRINELWALGPAPTQFGLSFAAGSTVSIAAGGTSGLLSINLVDPNTGTPTTNSTGFDIPVNLNTSSSGGSFSPTSVTIKKGSNVSDTFTYSDTKAGTPTLTGAASSVSSSNAILIGTVSPGTASKLAFSIQPSTPTNAGVAFATQPQVMVQDTYNNTVTGSTAAITLTLSGGDPTAVINGTNPVNAASGVAAFSGLSVNKGSATQYQFVASSSGLTSATSNAFTINITCNTSSLTVNTLADGAGDACNVTLRQAIGKATTGSTIDFAPGLLTTTGTGALQTISLTSALPALPAGVKIDAGCNTTAVVGRGRPTIAISGTSAGTGVSGFILNAGSSATTGNTIKGLAIVNFTGYGININGSSDNTITCSYIGTDDGITLKANAMGGINITGNAAQSARTNSIGLAGAATSGNVIAGVGGAGTSQPAIKADGLGAKNYLYHNYINYNASGTAALTGAQVSTVTPIKLSNKARVAVQQGNKERR